LNGLIPARDTRRLKWAAQHTSVWRPEDWRRWADQALNEPEMR
jgi:hypothetical protein